MVKFGLISSLFSSIFLVMRWFLIKIRGHDALSKRELFLGGFLSSLALTRLSASELGILKIVFYPRVFDFFIQRIIEKINYVDSENESEFWQSIPWKQTLFFVIMMNVCVYGWVYEPKTLKPSLNKHINNLVNITKGEAEMFEAF